MKILLLRPQIEAGGASRVIIQLIRGLKSFGIDIEIATSGGAWLPKLQEITTCHYLPMYPSTPMNFVKSIWGLRNILINESYQLLNPHHRFATLICNAVSLHKHIPLVSTVHEIKTDRTWWSKATFAKYAIVFSQAVKQNLMDYHDFAEQNIFVVSMGIDVVAPTPDQLLYIRRELSLKEEMTNISCITRLSEEKGCDIFLQAASLVLSKGYCVNFLLVGDGPQKEKLLDLAQNLNLNSSLQFTGWRNDIPSIIGISDFLILPSLTEGVGITIIEGMALAKPTIGTKTGGIPEVICDFETGILVPPGDIHSMTEAIISLINDPILCTQLGIAGQKLYKDRFSSMSMLEQLSNVFYHLARE